MGVSQGRCTTVLYFRVEHSDVRPLILVTILVCECVFPCQSVLHCTALERVVFRFPAAAVINTVGPRTTTALGC